MGKRDKGGREAKKPKKITKEVSISREPIIPTHVEVVPRKRKERVEDE
jgi:hypothetical protein